MKKIISLLLAAITAASALASCSTPDTVASISASAGTEKYVAMLEERLDVMPDSLVIATGDDASEYGISVKDFIDDEGYTIRANGGDVVILAKTGGGVDRAVRQFANYGNNENYNFTYGEGYRIGELTIEGHDISEYAVIHPDEADECMLYAMDELVRHVKLACGVTLPVYSMSDYAAASDKPARTITFSVSYPDLGDEAFTIQVASNGIVDIFCGRYRGILYGVYGLLNDMGWRFLGDGIEYLYEADTLDLTTDINRTEKPAIANRFASDYPIAFDLSVGSRIYFHGRYWNDKSMSKYGYYGVTREACHGLAEFAGDIDWGGAYSGFDVSHSQPCYTDEAVLQAIENHFRSYIERKLEAGAVPGKDLAYIDVSQFDSSPAGFCTCANCLQVVGREGSASGPVLKMTNRLADMAAKYSSEIDVLMLAYCGTNKPPRNEKPRDNVRIAYCFYYTDAGAICSNHSVTGEECSDDRFINKTCYKEFEGWKNICKPGTLQVWYYPMSGTENAFQTYDYNAAFDDMKYFIESEIDCIMFCAGGNNDPVLLTALSRLIWNADITRDEYYALLEEYFRIYYGAESGKYIYDYTTIVLSSFDAAGCFNSWGSPMLERINPSYIKSNFDYIVSLLDKALVLAENEEMCNRIEILRARMLYMGISVVHEDRYTNGTEDDRAYIAKLYAELHGLFIKHNIKVSGDTSAPASYDVTRSPSEHWFA